ncbi:MAG: TonB-dependent receptor [Proteobacteria bacterium]|nr:TonB-dependent receptor [Pseudomonadota bacterium]
MATHHLAAALLGAALLSGSPAQAQTLGRTPAPAPRYETVVVSERSGASDASQDTTAVGGDRLRRSARTSTFEALAQETAGLYVTARGLTHGVGNGATGGLVLRGLGGSPNTQVLVVEDGVPDYQGIFGHPIPEAYVPLLIEEVIVAKGGDSVLLGSNALGGALLIRSRWRDRPGYEVEQDAGGGSYATLQARAALLARLGAWDVATGVQALSTAGHRAGAGGDTLVATTALRYRWGSGLRLTARNKVVHLIGNDPGPVTHPQLDHGYEVWRDTLSVQLGGGRDQLRWSITPYLNVGLHRLYDGFRSLDYLSGVNATVDLRPHRAADLELGFAAQRVGGAVENRITNERPRIAGLQDGSFFGQLTLRPLPRLTTVVGARGLFSSRYGAIGLAKVGARWDLPEGFFLRSRVARSFRQPTLRELYLPFPVANPALRPEYALTADLGAGYASEHLELGCTTYRTAAKDMIRYFGVWPSAEVINLGRVVAWGVEGHVALKRLGPLSLAASGSWQDVGRYTRQNPDAKLNLTVEALQPLSARQTLGATASAEWVHGLYMGNYGRQALANVFVADLALRFRYTSPARRLTLEPYALLRNFLDRRYAYVENYPLPGFHVLAGLKVGI